MTVLVDLNIFIDVFQERQPHYQDSSRVLTLILDKQLTGYIAGHTVTTLYYLISRFSGNEKAVEVVDWVLERFEVKSADKEGFVKARTYNIKDFEDAVVSVCAKEAACNYIITRNKPDFKNSPVLALTPEEFLRLPEI